MSRLQHVATERRKYYHYLNWKKKDIKIQNERKKLQEKNDALVNQLPKEENVS
jgi:hypothetical protein